MPAAQIQPDRRSDRRSAAGCSATRALIAVACASAALRASLHGSLRRCGALAGLVVAAVASGQTDGTNAFVPGSWEILRSDPFVVPGGVLALPLAWVVPDDADAPTEPVVLPAPDPARFELRLTDDRVVSAVIGWLAPAIGRPAQSWTSAAQPIDVLDDPPDAQDRRRALAVPWLLYSLPPDVGFPLLDGAMLGEIVLEPRVVRRVVGRDRRLADAAETQLDVAPFDRATDRPDPLDPAEWFLAVLLARADSSPDALPPRAPGGPASRLFARHLAELWLAGIARLERADRLAAYRLGDRLVARGRVVAPSRFGLSESIDIALWPMDATQRATLLEILLDPSRLDTELAEAAATVFDSRPPHLAWIAERTGRRVEVVLANTTDEDFVARVAWLDAADDGVPIGVEVPARAIVRTAIDRPFDDTPSAFRRPRSIGSELLITVRSFPLRLAVSEPEPPARPPGALLGPFAAPLTLADVERGGARGPLPADDARAILRRADGAWEILIECAIDPLERAGRVDEIELVLGPARAPVRRVRIGRDGLWQARPAGARDGVTVRIRSFDDRWRAHVRLEDRLVERCAPAGSPNAFLIGLRRLDDGAVVASTLPALPDWSPWPGVDQLRLDAWDEFDELAPATTIDRR